MATIFPVHCILIVKCNILGMVRRFKIVCEIQVFKGQWSDIILLLHVVAKFCVLFVMRLGNIERI